MTIFCGDAVKWAREYDGPGHHAALMDPPYELSFMGKKWDASGVAFDVETWLAFKDVLLPGAFLMAFAGTRGYHRMATAIEDAGFIIHPAIGFVFGSGFPKATRIDTQIDREAGAERSPVPHTPTADGRIRALERSKGVGYQPLHGGGIHGHFEKPTEPATDLARAWSGHRYGLQALKPAFEFICVAQKPYEGRPLDCITKTGAGALNIDKARISGPPTTHGGPRTKPLHGGGQQTAVEDYAETLGRWPANFIVGSPEAAAMLDRQSGVNRSSVRYSEDRDEPGATWALGRSGVTARGHADGEASGVSRFFFRVQTAIDEADPVLYCAKSGRAERDAGLDGFAAEVKAAWEGDTRPNRNDGTTGIGNSGVQAIYRNPHPTLKPLSLCRHLASLLLPPPEYGPRRLFVPFAGVASEMCGADLAGWEIVNGVEQSAEYVRIGEARRRFWACHSGLFDELTQEPPTPTPGGGGGSLFDDGEGDQ